MRQRMPFALLGFDTDNDSVFMNETVQDLLRGSRAGVHALPSVSQERSGLGRAEERRRGPADRLVTGAIEGLEAAAALARLYASLRLFVNFFQPSFKLAGKGSRWREGQEDVSPARHALSASAGGHANQRGRAKPGERDLREPGSGSAAAGDPRGSGSISSKSPTVRSRAKRTLRPRRPSSNSSPGCAPRGGRARCVRPTSRRRRPGAGRRRPDPFVAVTAVVREWFEAEPWRTSRELFERLQEEQPGVFPDGQLRTLQRRLKGWRREQAHKLVFGAAVVEETLADSSSPPNI